MFIINKGKIRPPKLISEISLRSKGLDDYCWLDSSAATGKICPLKLISKISLRSRGLDDYCWLDTSVAQEKSCPLKLISKISLRSKGLDDDSAFGYGATTILSSFIVRKVGKGCQVQSYS